MFELLQPDQVPERLRHAPGALPRLPITELLPGQAIRIPLEGLSTAEARKMHGTLRTRACRASASTGFTYHVSKAEDCVYVVRVT